MMHYGSAPTAMAFPAAEVYVSHALERYGEEAKRRVRINNEVKPLVEELKKFMVPKGETNE